MSEFERAVFRVYENTIDGLNFDGIHVNFSTKLIKYSELIFRWLAILSLITLFFLHRRFVGEHKLNCLPALLDVHEGMPLLTSSMTSGLTGFGNNNHTNVTDMEGTKVFFNFTDDYILHMNVYNLEDELTNMKLVKLNSTSGSNSDEEPQFELQRKNPDFTYASTNAVLSLKSELQKKFEIVNITLPHHECFGEFPWIGGSIYGLVAYFDGVGTVVMNDLMYTSRSSGVLMKYSGSRSWWASEDLHLTNNDNDNENNGNDMTQHNKWGVKGMLALLSAANEMVWHKIGILFYACLAFFLLSTSTALLIRILLSSGVIILYPILLLLECIYARGFSMRTAYRLMTLAYPWLGMPMEILRIRRISAIPFLIGHATQILMYYVMYEGVQILISMWIYEHNLPDLLDVWLYSVMMLLRKLEYPAFMRGDVVIDRPRGLYNSLPYAYNGIFLPPEFTIFMPLNRRSRNVYDVEDSSDGDDNGSGGEEQEEVRDLEMGGTDINNNNDNINNNNNNEGVNNISPTETPLLYHHYTQGQGSQQRPSGTGTGAGFTLNPGRNVSSGASGSSSSSEGGRSSGLGLASYYSMSTPTVAPSGRRRRRRHRHNRQQSASVSSSPSSSSSINSPTTSNGQGDVLNDVHRSSGQDRIASEDEHYLEFESKDNDYQYTYGASRDTSSASRVSASTSAGGSAGGSVSGGGISDSNRTSRSYGGTTAVGRGLRRLAAAATGAGAGAGATSTASGGKYQALANREGGTDTYIEANRDRDRDMSVVHADRDPPGNGKTTAAASAAVRAAALRRHPVNSSIINKSDDGDDDGDGDVCRDEDAYSQDMEMGPLLFHK